MGSHSVTCHPTQVNTPRLTPATQSLRYQDNSKAYLLEWVWTGKPSRYVTSHLGQLSLPSLCSR